MATSSYSINLNLIGTLAELGKEQVFAFERTTGDHLLFDSIVTDPVFQDITNRPIDPSG